MGDQNWDIGLPELLLSCPVLLPAHLRRIDAAATTNSELRWMRRAVAEHPSVDISVLESMIRRGGIDDESLVVLIQERLILLRAEREHHIQRQKRETQKRRRRNARLRRADPAAYAILMHHEENVSIQETLELAEVGPTHDEGLVGGGKGAQAPDESDFESTDLPDTISSDRATALENGAAPTDDEIAQWRTYRAKHALTDENADQFDIWKLAPNRGHAAYALTWRDDNGRPWKYDGLYDSIDEVRKALTAQYDAVEVWIDDK
jgi:hypothetical protein